MVHASVLTLLAISLERYSVVCRQLRGTADDISKSLKTVLIIWLICGASNLPWFCIAEFRDSMQLDGTPIKVCRLPVTGLLHKTFVSLLCALYFVIPFFILFILYFRICQVLRITKKNADSRELTEYHHFRPRQRVRVQVINIIVSLVLIFFVFHLPYRVVSMWFTFADKYDIHNLGIYTYFNIVYSARIFFYLNHAINPIIYHFVSSKFRNALRFLLTNREKRGSLLSSNRKGNFNTPFMRPKNSRMLLVDEKFENRDVAQNFDRRLKSSSSRQKMNEFFPMYAHIIEEQDNEKYSNQDTQAKSDAHKLE